MLHDLLHELKVEARLHLSQCHNVHIGTNWPQNAQKTIDPQGQLFETANNSIVKLICVRVHFVTLLCIYQICAIRSHKMNFFDLIT